MLCLDLQLTNVLPIFLKIIWRRLNAVIHGGIVIKVLNLFAGLGGNRRLWGEDIQVTAIEFNPEIAEVYASLYPNDSVIVADAHKFLEDNFKNYDFIWSSPPCQSHSSARFNLAVRFRNTKPIYPDFSLYEEIQFLKSNCKAKWVVENVKPYYTPLITPTIELQRHLFWSNFDIHPKHFEVERLRTAQIPDLQRLHHINLDNVRLPNKRQCLRNCVLSELGLYIFEEAFH